MYPNPVSGGKVVITSSNSVGKQVEIYTLLGNSVYNKNLKFNEVLDVSNLTVGIYIIKVKENERISTRKLIIKQ